MWIPKWKRDRQKGVDSPMPTQVVSNEEFIPRPQNKQQAQVEKLIMQMADEKSKKLGMPRRDFLRSNMGMATAYLASNMVYGNYWAVAEEETLDAAMSDEIYPKGEYFIFDVQAHFTNGIALDFRNAPFVKDMGFDLKNDADAYGFINFIKEMYFDSETSLVCISGVPGKEDQRAEDGRVLEGAERTGKGFGSILPSWLMSQRKKEINDIAQSQRAVCQGNCAPNHYWDKATNKPDFNALFEQMEREVKNYGIDSWKWYCHTDPGRSGNGFKLDDEVMTYPFYAKSIELGLKTFSVHKGFSAQSRTLGHLAHPADIEKAALDHPDLNFIIYHSALKHGPGEPGWGADGFFDPTTGDFEWHADLMKIKERNPKMNNVYPEIGSSFGVLSLVHPEMCQHLMGRNIKTYGIDHVIWGTDCLWWGSPQWVIDAFKRFQFTDEMTEKFGYQKLTKEDKAKIFGLNAARIYGINPDEKRNGLPKDAISRFKTAYEGEGWKRENAAHGWVRDDTRA
ncbi:MAG: amidohydrolase [Candidatus Hydrogenedentes bacterium]|nr:amidohydrolase [Candidatus Hydrogenedentota bacterium]